jgi:hypothetical protein
MRRVIVILLMLLAPAMVVAQEQDAASAQQRWFSTVSAAAAADTVPVAVRQPQAEDTVAAVQRRRRRGSMVGYIDDPTVGSKLRVRFEAAFENRVPDRAEFFYAKCGCYRDLPAGHAARDTLAPGPGPGVPSHVNFQQVYLSGEYGLNERISAFVQLPLRWIQPQFGDGGAGFDEAVGLGDLRAGLKLGLIVETDRLVTLQVQAHLPTGDPAKGLGTDHTSLEPALLLFQQLSDRLGLEAQGGVWLPLGGSAGVPTDTDERFSGTILYGGIGPSFELYRSERLQFAPVVELLGWRVMDGFQTAATSDAGGTSIVNLKIGTRTSFGQGSIYLGYGTALTSASWYDDIIRAEYRHTF